MTDPLSPRDYKEALAWFQAHEGLKGLPAPTPSGNWGGYCLMDSRFPYGIPAQALTAFGAWVAVDDDSKHITSNLDDAPIGAALFSKGSNPAGHIWIKGNPFSSGAAGSWSNDLVKYGQLHKVALHAPRDAWGHTILGWTNEINGYDLRLDRQGPVQPKQKPYRSLLKAIDAVDDAIDKAREVGDKADLRVLQREKKHLKRKYERLTHP